MRKAILLVLSIFSIPAMAAEDNVISWTPPTTYENGTPLPPTEIKEYRVSVTLGGVAQPDLTAAGGSNATYTHRVNNRGEWCYTLRTVSVDDVESGPSNTACKTVTHGNPNPPRDVGVN